MWCPKIQAPNVVPENLSVTVLDPVEAPRFGHLYGAAVGHRNGAPHVAKSILPNYFQRFHHGGPADFVHVDDCINVILWFYKNKNKSGLFNVGTGKARTFLDITKILFNEFKKEKKIDFINTPKNIRKHYQYFTMANIRKLRKYGYVNKFKNIEDGIKLFIKENY